MPLQNDLLLRTIKGEKTERTPVWLMRQAGRILPEYRAVRARMKNFKHLVETPERAAEVSIQPLDILGVDAVIIFSDILVIPEAMGLPYDMVENKGPVFFRVVEQESDLEQLHVAQYEDFHYTPEAIEMAVKEIDGRVPMIGFAGAPWTIFAYMVEGTGSKTFSKARKMLYTRPDMAKKLLQLITDSTIAYLEAQVAAGVNLVQVFDSWAGILPDWQYAEFSLPYIKQICDAIDKVPVTVFAKGAYGSMEAIAGLNCQTIGLDWNMNVAHARTITPGKTLQGNLDPAALYADFKTIEKMTEKMLNEFGPYRHIANLGHGVYPDMTPDAVKCFIEAVKEKSAAKR